jgi:hypothetical protein
VTVLSVAIAGWTTAWLAKAQSLPIDARATCTVTTGSAVPFAQWFESGVVTVNGVVRPADSLRFSEVSNCSFYQWSYQMFLWLTSPAPPAYGGGGRIFDSPAFFDVSPVDSNLNRTFIAHTNRLIRPLQVRVAQVGAHGLQVVLDRHGTIFEIDRPRLSDNGRPLVIDATGRQVEVFHIQMCVDRQPVFLDWASKPIANPRAIISPELNKALTVQRFMMDKTSIFLTAAGNVIDTEVGQADGGVLLAQNGSLIYYMTSVNDVYAYFLTGTKNGSITPRPTQFPTTPAQLNKITAFAAAHGKTFPDPEALAVEVKTAWIEASGLSNVSGYITRVGTVPSYDRSNPNHWVPNGQKTVKLALVGMHVVGSTKGHPEMIWATFEHFGNTPNAEYSYESTTGIKTVPQNTTGTWLFSASGSSGPFNVMQQQNPFGTNDIVAISPHTIGPSDTIRFKPFGAATDATPNPWVNSTAASNTEVISINNSVLRQLLPGDIRSNYYMTGATWSIDGATTTPCPAPSQQDCGNFGNPGNPLIFPGKLVGTSQLSNSTMETYQQRDTLFNPSGNNCFSCHQTNTVGVSHMFCTPGVTPPCSRGLLPLFP